jgi:RimJ/RimL family protein N-acetyltransferase
MPTTRVSGEVLESLARVPTVGDGGDPSAGESVVRLRNGAAVRVRPICPDDGPRLLALCHRLSPRTVYQRFFSPRQLLPEEAQAFANVDYREHMAVVAEVDRGQEPELIGVARYAPSDEETIAEIALVVEDGWQALGLGSILLEEILRAGEQRGIHRFSADVLTENRRALRLLARFTTITQQMTSDGVTRLVFRRRDPSGPDARHLDAGPLGRSRKIPVGSSTFPINEATTRRALGHSG